MRWSCIMVSRRDVTFCWIITPPMYHTVAVCRGNPLIVLSVTVFVSRAKLKAPWQTNTVPKHIDVIVSLAGSLVWLSFVCTFSHSKNTCTHTLPFMCFLPAFASLKIDGVCRLRRKGLGSDTLLFAVQKRFTVPSCVCQWKSPGA